MMEWDKRDWIHWQMKSMYLNFIRKNTTLAWIGNYIWKSQVALHLTKCLYLRTAANTACKTTYILIRVTTVTWQLQHQQWQMNRCSDCPGKRGSKIGQVNWGLRRCYDANFEIMVISEAKSLINCQVAKKYSVTECPKMARPQRQY